MKYNKKNTDKKMECTAGAKNALGVYKIANKGTMNNYSYEVKKPLPKQTGMVN